jgi:competence protein ComEC
MGGRVSVDIHLLNVGHGDCTFIDFNGDYLTMIDVNNSKSLPEKDVVALARRRGLSIQQFRASSIITRSLEDQFEELLVDPYNYYQQHFAGRPIFRYIQTHPDMDHMSGLHRFFWAEGRLQLLNFWDVSNSKELDATQFEGKRYAYIDWQVYQRLREGQGPDGPHTILRLPRGTTGQFYTTNGIEILSPNKFLTDLCDTTENWNNASYILKVTHGGRSVILPGDAESIAWGDVLDDLGPDSLECDVLKAAHHGRQSGYYEPAAKAMDPDIVICSVGKEPATDATDEYEAMGARVFTTREEGTIKAQLWGDGEVWVSDHAGQRIATLPPL